MMMRLKEPLVVLSLARERTGYAGGAGARSDARRRERGPIVGCLCPLHGFLVVQIQLLPILYEIEEHRCIS